MLKGEHVVVFIDDRPYTARVLGVSSRYATLSVDVPVVDYEVED